MMIQCSIKLLEHEFSRIMMKRLEMSMMGELKFLIGFESSNSRYACSYVKASTLIKVLSIEILVLSIGISRTCSRSLTSSMPSPSRQQF
jgi:hypothetical protein